MRVNIKKLIFLGLITISINAGTNIKHTLLMPRPIIDNMPIEKTGQHDPFKFKKLFDHNINFQVSAFTKHSIKGEDIGKYFAVNGTNQIVIKNATTSVDVMADADIDVWDRFLIHNQAAVAATTIDADFNLNPKQEVYGIRIDFFGLLNNPIPNSFFKISMPITYIENHLNSKYNTDAPDADGDKISDFFIGKTINSGVAVDLQEKLAYGKIDSANKTIFGIADIDVHFGYRLIDNKKNRIYISGLVTIPTGNRPKGEFMFEPIYGNGNHVGIGLEIDGQMRLWKKKNHKGFLGFALKHKYTMDGTEKRIIPLNLPNYPFAHYYLAQKTDAVANTPLFPAANILAQNVTIRPGNSVEGFLGFKFKTKRFLIDTGYNLYFKEKENISLKTAWIDDVYSIVKEGYNTTQVFDVANNALVKINNDILNLNGAVTPNQLSHKLFASIGYNFNLTKNPAHIGIGVAYEFASNNHELEGYEFWLKTNRSF